MSHFTVSPVGVAMVKGFEGLRLVAYPDPISGGNPWTIGYGDTGPGVVPGLRITEAEAERRLLDRLNNDFGKNVNEEIGDAPTTQAQFDAMVSLAYNIGNGGFDRSSVLREHLEGSYARASNAFLMWNRAGGRVIDALTRRRQMERALYLSDLPGAEVPAYTRIDAARDMQTALAKLGLYRARIDGDWGRLSRIAYVEFLEE